LAKRSTTPATINYDAFGRIYEAHGWSLNPGRYVGIAPGETVSDEDFKERLEELNEELERLNVKDIVPSVSQSFFSASSPPRVKSGFSPRYRSAPFIEQ
jgi:hypothetical protein